MKQGADTIDYQSNLKVTNKMEKYEIAGWFGIGFFVLGYFIFKINEIAGFISCILGSIGIVWFTMVRHDRDVIERFKQKNEWKNK